MTADDTPPRVWWSPASQWLIVPHQFGDCYDVVSIGKTGADVTGELSALPADAVELRPVVPTLPERSHDDDAPDWEKHLREWCRTQRRTDQRASDASQALAELDRLRASPQAVPDTAEPLASFREVMCDWCDQLAPVRSDGKFMGHPARDGWLCAGSHRLAVDPLAVPSLSTDTEETP